MIVAGTQMHRAAAFAVHIAFKQRYLAVHLQVGQAIEHAAARAFQLFAPEQVVEFIKTGMGFKQHHDLLAVLRRLGQRSHDGAVAAYAVERLLDGAHLGILRRVLHQVHHRIKRVIGMIHQPVALVNALKHILAHQLGNGQRLHAFVLHFRTLDHAVEAHEHLIQIQRAGDAIAAFLLHLEDLHQKGEHLFAHALLRFQTHHRAGSTLAQHFTHGRHHIGTGLLHNGEVLVAQHAEHRRMLHFLAGEQTVGIVLDDVFQTDQVLHILFLRQIKQTGQGRGQSDHFELGSLAAAAHQLDAQIQFLLLHAVGNQILHLQVGDDLMLKQHLFALAHGIIQREGGEQAHALQIEFAAHAFIEGVLAVALAQDGLVHLAVQLFAIHAAKTLFIAFTVLINAVITHLQKFIHIGGHDRQKLCALQKRVGRVIRFVHDPAVKAQPAQLAVFQSLALDLAHARTHVSTPSLW